MPDGLLVYCIVVSGSGENVICAAFSVHLDRSLPCLLVTDLAASSIAAHSSLEQRETDPSPQYFRWYLPLTFCPNMVRRSLPMYWCHPLYWPLGGRSKRAMRPSRSLQSVEPRRSHSPASVIFFHAVSRITAPGESMLPSRLASTREPPLSYHRCSDATAAVAPADGDLPRASIALSVGHSGVIRTSSVAAALAEARTLASVAFG